MKKIISILLTLSMAFSLVACSTEPTSDVGDNDNSEVSGEVSEEVSDNEDEVRNVSLDELEEHELEFVDFLVNTEWKSESYTKDYESWIDNYDISIDFKEDFTLTYTDENGTSKGEWSYDSYDTEHEYYSVELQIDGEKFNCQHYLENSDVYIYITKRDFGIRFVATFSPENLSEDALIVANILSQLEFVSRQFEGDSSHWGEQGYIEDTSISIDLKDDFTLSYTDSEGTKQGTWELKFNPGLYGSDSLNCEFDMIIGEERFTGGMYTLLHDLEIRSMESDFFVIFNPTNKEDFRGQVSILSGGEAPTLDTDGSSEDLSGTSWSVITIMHPNGVLIEEGLFDEGGSYTIIDFYDDGSALLVNTVYTTGGITRTEADITWEVVDNMVTYIVEGYFVQGSQEWSELTEDPQEQLMPYLSDGTIENSNGSMIITDNNGSVVELEKEEE